MLHIAICDDEAPVRRTLTDYIERYRRANGLELEVSVFESADRLLVDYPKDLDILLLDIQMGGVDGMSAAKRIRQFDERLCIIFITSMVNYALEGYSVRAFGFVKKPFNYNEFEFELDGALRQLDRKETSSKYISVSSGRQTYMLRIADIVYCEVRNHDMLICEKDKSAQYSVTMTDLEQQLKGAGFFRCHSSFLVNAEYIETIGTSSVTMKNGAEIPISQRRKKEFLTELYGFIGKNI